MATSPLCSEIDDRIKGIIEIANVRAVQVIFEDLKPLTFASHAYDDFHLLMPLFGEP